MGCGPSKAANGGTPQPVPPGAVSVVVVYCGWFEVTVDGNLVFSTKSGHGKFNTPAKKERVMAAIAAALEKKRGAAPNE